MENESCLLIKTYQPWINQIVNHNEHARTDHEIIRELHGESFGACRFSVVPTLVQQSTEVVTDLWATKQHDAIGLASAVLH